jgi:hypothetical protein
MTTAPHAPVPPPGSPVPPTSEPPTSGPPTTDPPTPGPPTPGPPPGPGVYPPFPAPPTEGRGRRIGLGLGIGAAVLVLFCGGGIAAVVGLVTVTGRALNEQAHVVVGDYFEDVQAKRYNDAYDQQCAEVKRQESRAEFAGRMAAGEPITGYQVGDVDITDVDLTVPVDVTYGDGQTGRLQVYLGQDTETGRFQVCGVEE